MWATVELAIYNFAELCVLSNRKLAVVHLQRNEQFQKCYPDAHKQIIGVSKKVLQRLQLNTVRSQDCVLT